MTDDAGYLNKRLTKWEDTPGTPSILVTNLDCKSCSEYVPTFEGLPVVCRQCILIYLRSQHHSAPVGPVIHADQQSLEGDYATPRALATPFYEIPLRKSPQDCRRRIQ